MNEFGLNEDQFWLRSPAAAEIFEYQQSNSEFSYMGFDSGGVSRDRRSTYAFFSGVALSGLGKDHVMVRGPSRTRSSEPKSVVPHDER